MKLRTTNEADRAAVHKLLAASFPNEDLSGLVDALLDDGGVLLSLGAFAHGTLIGHVVMSQAHDAEGEPAGALLGPLAVLPHYQRQGIGRQLVEGAGGRLATKQVGQLFVLGDPNYYRRFGFAPETTVEPPYPLPAEWAGAWQSLVLTGAPKPAAGKIVLPAAWMSPALWRP